MNQASAVTGGGLYRHSPRDDGASRPRVRACSTALARLCTPSFSHTCRMCVVRL